MFNKGQYYWMILQKNLGVTRIPNLKLKNNAISLGSCDLPKKHSPFVVVWNIHALFFNLKKKIWKKIFEKKNYKIINL